MRNFIIVFLLLAGTSIALAQNPSTTTGKASFFSSAPLENIEAHTEKVVSVINPTAKTVAFKVFINTFEFPNKLMQEHFNEKYMESDKFPMATYAAKINEDIDLTKDGVYKVTTTGKLTMHGVTKDRTIPGVITVKNGKINITSEFKVALKDHNITIPELVFNNIAEVIDVKVNIDFNSAAAK